MGTSKISTDNNFILLLILTLTIFAGFILLPRKHTVISDVKHKTVWWNIQSIDTVKYSRDVAREKLNDQSFDKDIDTQVRLIAETGATHVAVGTPYDPEFIPFLKRWVSAARKYGLNVWFRGNLSGWERWFGYEKITRDDHVEKIRDFITGNADIFESEDIFSSCPECENGGPGDPRSTKDINGHRKFLINEYKVVNSAFKQIGKNVRSSYFSMNGDVANLIMDEQTTIALGGIVVIDHYVGTPEKLASDIEDIAKKSGGKVVLGEFGAPIPDIHGKLNEDEQAEWINDALSRVSQIPELVGVNYWTGFGGSTELWGDTYTPRKIVEVVGSYFEPKVVSGSVKNRNGNPIRNANVTIGVKSAVTDNEGIFSLPVVSSKYTITVKAEGYLTMQIQEANKSNLTIVLDAEKVSLFYKIWRTFKSKL